MAKEFGEMAGTKVLLILLIVIVVLFVVFTISGTGRTPPTPVDSKKEMKIFKSQSHSTFKAFNSLLGSFGPKLKAKELQPPLAVFDLQSAPRYSVTILPDSDHKFRQAKFTAQPGKACMRISFVASGPVPNNMSRNQSLPDPDDDKNSNEFTFTIFSGGGTLTIDRFSLPCKVSLQ